MKKLIVLITSVLFISCGEPPESKPTMMECYICNANEKEKVANFLTKNIGPANNKSDEEMEDVIYELRKSAVKLYCRQIMAESDGNFGIDINKINKKADETIFDY